MKSNRITSISFTVILGCLATPLTHSAEPQYSADELLKKSVQSVYTKNEESIYVMKLIGPSGAEESVRKMKIWFKSEKEDEAKILLKFLEPADIRGTGLLSLVEKGKSPDQYIFLPALKKVRRIVGGNKNESFLGSDFSMADLSANKGDVSMEHKIEGDEKCEDTTCYRIVSSAKPNTDKENLSYSKVVIHMRKDNFLVPKTEFFNLSGQLEKVMTLSGIHKDGSRWVVDRMQMENVIAKHKTIIEIEKRDSTKVPANSVFTPSFLERN